jgi:hypothetical protein
VFANVRGRADTKSDLRFQPSTYTSELRFSGWGSSGRRFKSCQPDAGQKRFLTLDPSKISTLTCSSGAAGGDLVRWSGGLRMAVEYVASVEAEDVEYVEVHSYLAERVCAGSAILWPAALQLPNEGTPASSSATISPSKITQRLRWPREGQQ